MAYNGSGVFNRLYTWANDAAASIKIRADRMDNEMNGFATGLTTCITKDGQTTITAHLPMADFHHTGVGDGEARDDYASVSQVQDGKLHWVAAGGTADAITATYTIHVTALVDGQICYVRAGAANATTTPTFSPNSLTAHTIVKNGGQALAAGDIYGAGHELILRYKLADTRWELLNPAVYQSTAVTDATIATTDVTTNNVTSTKHGWTPKSPADATKFLNGAATPDYAVVKDSDLSTSDITTNNVTTSKHGFAPKAPNDATKFLDGTGAWAVPSGGFTASANKLVLGSITVQWGKYTGGANSPTITFPTAFSGTPTYYAAQIIVAVGEAATINQANVTASQMVVNQFNTNSGSGLTGDFVWIAVGPT